MGRSPPRSWQKASSWEERLATRLGVPSLLGLLLALLIPALHPMSRIIIYPGEVSSELLPRVGASQLCFFGVSLGAGWSGWPPMSNIKMA